MTSSTQAHDGKAKLYLASSSPRRQELLLQLGLPFLLLPQHIDESGLAGEDAESYVRRLAQNKARAALQDPLRQEGLPVLAADTTVVSGGQVLGKPASLQEAMTMLGCLSGTSHQVMTAIAVGRNLDQIQVRLSSSTVSFRALAEEEIVAYWYTGEPRDKAGAYAIQGLGAMFVSRIEGSYSSVVGLPLFETLQLLAEFGITGLSLLKEAQHER